MGTRNRAPREITMAEIEQRFPVGEGSYWFGDQWCPAVHRCKGGGFAIRFLKSRTDYGNGGNFTFDYFELDAEGVITTAPRGYARDYKPGRVVDIAAAVERYATPDLDALRVGGVW